MRTTTDLLRPASSNQGLVLLVTIIMIFILLIMALTFFAMASYETRQSTYREESSEAFYLADAGVERTRGEFLDDGKWRASPMITGVALGNGTYDLYVADSTYGGDAAIYIYAEGHVDRASRAVEVWAEGVNGTPPLFSGRSIEQKGTLCLDGWAHANVEADFNNMNNGASCDGLGDYSDGDIIRPPVVYTEPGPSPYGYPGATYYFLSYVPASPPFFEIQDASGNLVDLGDDLSTQITNGPKGPVVTFKNEDLATYFNPTNGLFRPGAGDSTVVLNFAERWNADKTGIDRSPAGYVTVHFQGRDQDPPVNAMIINSHYKGGANVDDRWKTENWEGGTLVVDGVVFEPRQAVSTITHEFLGSENAQMGTLNYPAMTYVTGTVGDSPVAGSTYYTGALIALGDIYMKGNTEVTYVDDFEQAFPKYLEDVVFGQAVALDFFVWREVPADTR